MALHVTPCSAPSRAVVRVSPSRPCLAATYADLKAEARSAWTEAILMTRPQSSIARDVCTALGPCHQYRLRPRAAGFSLQIGIRGCQARPAWADPRYGPGGCRTRR